MQVKSTGCHISFWKSSGFDHQGHNSTYISNSSIQCNIHNTIVYVYIPGHCCCTHKLYKYCSFRKLMTGHCMVSCWPFNERRDFVALVNFWSFWLLWNKSILLVKCLFASLFTIFYAMMHKGMNAKRFNCVQLFLNKERTLEFVQWHSSDGNIKQHDMITLTFGTIYTCTWHPITQWDAFHAAYDIVDGLCMCLIWTGERGWRVG